MNSMKITQETTIEEMIDSFSPVIMRVTEGKYLVAYSEDGPIEQGKETIRLEGEKQSWIKEAQFDAGTKRDVILHFQHENGDVCVRFSGSDFPESLNVGDRIACVCSKTSNDPWIVSYWLPYDVYVRYLRRIKQKYAG